jgi:hypothetical protein
VPDNQKLETRNQKPESWNRLLLLQRTIFPCIGLFRKIVRMQKNWKFKTGILLIILSTLLFTSLLAVPFLDVAGKTKITISTIAVILGEITFWTGSILLGKELLAKYKSYLNPKNWFKRKTVPLPVEDSETTENTVSQTREF